MLNIILSKRNSLQLFKVFCSGCLLYSIPFSINAADKNVHFYGTLIAEPCEILPADENILVDMRSMVEKYFYLYERTPGEIFTLHLINCDLDIGKTVKVAFKGIESSELTGFLAVPGNQTSKGIAIGLETPEGKPLFFNQYSRIYQLSKGNSEITLRAFAQREPTFAAAKKIELGTFNVSATFHLEYE